MESWREELYHHGILGQKWGIRRFQNEDGSLTSKGKARYKDNDTQSNSAKQTNSDKPISKRTAALRELNEKHEKFKQSVANSEKGLVDTLLSRFGTYSLARAAGHSKASAINSLLSDRNIGGKSWQQFRIKEGYVEDYEWNRRNE